jgi:hypothetical protein
MIEGGWQLTTYIGMGFAGIALLLYYRCDVVKRSPVISPPHNESRSRS